jgi:NAD(P)-dependent dehydrogenase (short-subunit alcohol dehydrogenase family)
MGWNPSQLPSLAGMNAIVTGANSGIGWHTAAELARHGAQVTLACRSVTKAERAADRIRATAPGAQVLAAELNLAALSSVADFASGWTRPLHLLVNNAGVMAPPRWLPTADGFEMQFGTNHLGHFALTGQLLRWLQVAEQGRVVTVSSLAHRSGTATVLEGNPPAGYHPRRAYANSKLANLLFGLELQRRASEHGSSLTSTAAHPGLAATSLFLSKDGIGASPVIRGLGTVFGRVVCQSARAGANPTLYAAVQAAAGSYTGPQRLGESRGPVGPARIGPLGQDVALASKLWDVSEQLTDVQFRWR